MFPAPSFRPTQEMLRLAAQVDEFKGAWQSLRNIAPDRLTALRRVATVESVASSTRIEGVRLTNAEVEALLSGLETRTLASRDEQEVAGYADVMETIFAHYEDLPLTENHIQQLHGILLRRSDKDERHRGSYKTLRNDVQAFAPDGTPLGVVFETASPFATPFQMAELVTQMQTRQAGADTHPLLDIGVFVMQFLAIHPFQDGNGRLSRALTTLLLLRAGYLYVPYISLESIIEENKEAYYLALRRTQTTLARPNPNTNPPDWESWLTFFLRALHIQTVRLSARLTREHLIEAALPELSVRILEMVRERERVTRGELERVTGAAKSTLRARLNELVARGLLTRHGQGPATWYAHPPARLAGVGPSSVA